MSASVDSTGLNIETYSTIFNTLVDLYASAFGNTDIQRERIRNNLESVAGNILRILAEQIYENQEALLDVYNAQGFYASGAALDKVVALLGVTRLGELQSECTVTATGVAATVLANGIRASSSEDGTTWEVIDGPYTIGGGGTVTVTLQCTTDGEANVDSGTVWTILSPTAGLTSFTAATQTITGNDAETDAELRERAQQEAFRRGTNTFEAIEAAVAEVEGVTYVRCYQNDALTEDDDGIPGKAIWVITEGGDADEVREAIANSKPGGIQAHGTELGNVDLGSGRVVPIGFDYVTTQEIDVTVVLTTYSSEELAPADVTTQVGQVITDYLDALEIGQDVLPYRLSGAIYASGIQGIDSFTLTLARSGDSLGSAILRMAPDERAIAGTINVTEAAEP
jgi:uncharacterized phage protein gp47/JayE